MQAIKNLVAKVEGYWSAAFNYVGTHPKTAIVIAAVAVAVALYL